LSIVTTGGNPTRRTENLGISGLSADPGETWRHTRGSLAAMVNTALRPIGHLTAWVVWHAMRVSLLDDLDRPRPPAG
jgi:hypothetical protein